MARCLRCGAGNEWLQGEVKAEVRSNDLLSRSLTILGDIIDPNDCGFDHHGYCQEHGWFDADIPCPHKRAKELLNEVKAG